VIPPTTPQHPPDQAAAAQRPVWGLGFSPGARSVLERLQQAGVVHAVAPAGCTSPSASDTLSQQWRSSAGFVVVGATGLVVRLIAPLLQDKSVDPAVVVVDPEGRFAIPLLGSHSAGGEALSQRVAALLGGSAVVTGHSGGSGPLAVDAFGGAWGWRRGAGDWSGLMRRVAAGQAITIRQDGGSRLWRQLVASAALPQSATDGGPADLVVSCHHGPGCRWHPPGLWLGIGCERGTSRELLERLIDRALMELQLAPQAVAGLASACRKADEAALLELAHRRAWPLRLFAAEALAAVTVPNPSAAVAAELGTPSVAEAAALLAAGTQARLLLPKRIERRGLGERGAGTLAIAEASPQRAPHQGHLHLVGSGPGQLDLLTPDARQALAASTAWVGYGLYLDLLEPLRRPDQLRLDGRLTEERERCRQALELACQGLPVALVSSGDSGIYAMAGLALELWLQQPADGRPSFSVHPGISALQLAAARLGAPLMHDFCCISLSDRLTPWAVIERRLRAAAAGDFVVALYNPRSRDRDWQLGRARELLLAERPGRTPVALCRQLGRRDERVSLHTLEELPIAAVDMLALVLVGNGSTYVRDGHMVTPRGYPGAELS